MTGYFSVSFTFGIMAASYGIAPGVAGLMSLTNLTSAGQFAGLSLIYQGTTILEIFLTQLVINLRYCLMSLTITQNLQPSVDTKKRFLMSFFVTDEVFAVCAVRTSGVSFPFMMGLGLGSMAGWFFGTITGAIANNLLPLSVQSALGIALYGMFIAIIMPNVRRQVSILVVVLVSVGISCMLYYVPVFSNIPQGFTIIIGTVAGAFIGAMLFPEAGKIRTAGDDNSPALENIDNPKE